MSEDQIKRFIYFVFDRFAPNHEPSEQQIEHAIKDFEANQ
jgi:hypothetical protein